MLTDFDETDPPQVLAAFYNLCAEILLAKASPEDVKRITKAMAETGQAGILRLEFSRMSQGENYGKT